MPKEVIIVGASARAAAESAAAAGYHVHAFDLFTDEDLARVATATRIASHDYPNSLTRLLERAPASAPWLYTGGIENHTELIDKICRQRELLGSSSKVVRQTRDPNWLTKVVSNAGWRVPRISAAPELGMIGKPKKHCGGWQTRLVSEGREIERDDFDYQQFIPGPVYGGVFVGNPQRGVTQFLGATRQTIASDGRDHPLAAAHPFAYTGSEGPVELDSADRGAWRALGEALSAATPLCGLFGVDAVKHATRGWTLLELNPRWTASVELLERAFAFNAFRWHHAACRGTGMSDLLPGTPVSPQFGVKRIVYAADRIEIDRKLKRRLDHLLCKRSRVSVHDVPRLGTTIDPLRPILTLMAMDTSISAAKKQLNEVLELFA